MEEKFKILTVWGEQDLKKLLPKICWEYENPMNAYFMIGVLENIKQELINEIEKKSFEKENGKDN